MIRLKVFGVVNSSHGFFEEALVSANEALIPESQLLLCGVVEGLLRPCTVEELLQAGIAKTT